LRDDRLFKIRHVEKKETTVYLRCEFLKKKNDKYTGDALHNKYPER